MKTYRVGSFSGPAAVILFATAVTMTTSCVERRVEYVPVYSAQTVSRQQPEPQPGQQTLYQPTPGTVPLPSTNWQGTEPPLAYTNALPPTTIVPQAPPSAQIEVVPVAPGPDYCWVPGYWYWGGRGWLWIGGRWTVRPWHGAIWVGGGWARGRGGWHWHGGHWR